MTGYESTALCPPPLDTIQSPPQPAEPTPSAVLNEVIGAVSDPLGELAKILPTDPAEQSKIPYGWAVIAFCGLLVLWGASLGNPKR